MATDSSAGSNVDIPPVDHPAPAAGPTPKKAVGNGIHIDAGQNKTGQQPATASTTNKSAGQPVKAKTEAKPAAKAAAPKKELVAKAMPGKGTAGAKTKAAPKAESGSKEGASTREELEELEKVGALGMMTLVPAWMISAIVHMVILLIFGLLLMPEKKKDELKALVANVSENSEAVDEVADISEQTEEVSSDVTDLPTTSELASTTDVLTPTEINDSPAATAEMVMAEVGIATAPASDLLKDLSVGTGGTGKGSLSGRAGGDAAKRAAGATDATEAAVARALKWLAEHQYPDGSWSFDHSESKCQGQCSDNGKLKDARFAATGLALLPFLGAGQTHKKGKYKEQVQRGLYWLGSNMSVSANGGDMSGGGGSMYGHGIATIALCEGYAMTQDKQLAPPAQQALNFIMYAQDPVGGGWRYGPRQPGDTSAVGWQIMALKSGYLGYLQVGKATVHGATKFLDSAQAENGAYYGYTGPGQGPATTAVGLLCRMYLGWEHEKPALEKGVKYLASLGPQTSNMYFSYYATQVIHQYDGPDGDIWQAWNVKMRDSLVASQAMEKHETGSWMFKGADHGFDAGGRLYCTAMAAMTLEIYYRYMPIYTKKSQEDDWLD
ncbi:MAG TPA: prenyltransferase/squalene oxidase repeat-containing protein [Pirellulales bacterium]|nr:prenyltransferase/squalene oxidase repeat-containing protein [Pirellulales bacterium]